MSGGVDSSVAALLMKQVGYEVVGVFMKNWSSSKNDYGECCWKGERREAMKVAGLLDISFMTIDSEKEYRQLVVDEMFTDYKKGITPNPDVLCNEKVKFPILLKVANKIGADYLVTGHYARLKKSKNGFEMLRAKDESKDQSYFLYRLKSRDFAKILFPIGNYTKKQVREIARKNKFPNHDKKGTVGICFIGKINLKEFLQKKIKPKKGKILDSAGNVIGEHDGIYYYTIGQRLGSRFGIEIDKRAVGGKDMSRWYVASKNSRKNELVVAPAGHNLLYRRQIMVKNFYLISDSVEGFKKKKTRLHARIRNVGELLPSVLNWNKNKKRFEIDLKVKDKRGITGVSEGQALVLYSGKKILGGGVIGF